MTHVVFYSIVVLAEAYVPGGCPPDSGKTIIFWAKAKFFGQKPAAKKYFFVFIKQKNGIHSV